MNLSLDLHSEMLERVLANGGEVLEVSRDSDYLPPGMSVEMLKSFGEDHVEDYYPKQDKPSWSPGFGAPMKRKGKKKR